MQPRIQNILPKKLVGKTLRMSLAGNKTRELWQSFMPRRKEIIDRVNSDLISMQVYDPSFRNFDLHAEFDKWAVVEVSDYALLPDGMMTYDLPGGLYAVFIHKGPASEGERTFRFIFQEWLPNSEYELDQRPHFEVLGDKYKNDAPDSEEEIWIPIRKKSKVR